MERDISNRHTVPKVQLLSNYLNGGCSLLFANFIVTASLLLFVGDEVSRLQCGRVENCWWYFCCAFFFLLPLFFTAKVLPLWSQYSLYMTLYGRLSFHYFLLFIFVFVFVYIFLISYSFTRWIVYFAWNTISYKI